jgi:hypothetical protein
VLEDDRRPTPSPPARVEAKTEERSPGSGRFPLAFPGACAQWPIEGTVRTPRPNPLQWRGRAGFSPDFRAPLRP